MPPWRDLAGATSGHDSADSQAAEDLWPAPTDPTGVADRLLDEYRPHAAPAEGDDRRTLSEDMKVNTKQHERPKEQGEDEVEELTKTGDHVSGTECYYQTDEQINESANRNTAPFDDVH